MAVKSFIILVPANIWVTFANGVNAAGVNVVTIVFFVTDAVCLWPGFAERQAGANLIKHFVRNLLSFTIS
jgi:hypothetical protein